MTVASELNRKTYAGDDATTSFSTSPVVFFDSADLTVYVVTDATDVATTLVEGTDYTVSGGSGSTGTVNLAGGSDPHGALFSGTTLVIVRDLSILQATDLVNNDSSDAEVLEDALDRAIMILQQLSTRIDRSAALADSDVTGASTELPTPTASKLLGWNSAADGLTNYASSAIIASIVPTAFMETVLDDADAATARSTLGLGSAAVEPTTTFWSTGDVKVTLKTTADTGWVLMNDGTIGSASSGATTRANADTEALFTLLWTNTADAQCAVSTGRGASAAADFAANKTIALPKALGRALAVYGAGSGLTSRALALATGSEDAIVVAHDHSITDPGHTHPTNAVQGETTGGPTQISTGGAVDDLAAATVSSNTTGITVDSEGASGTGANMQPTLFLNVMVKL
jgi:microcystin-dependent protein